MVLLEYLSQNVLVELLRMPEEGFGLPSNGTITLSYDSTLLEYVISLARGHMPKELEKALLSSITTCHHSASSSLVQGLSHELKRKTK
ncbi:hypothetical protein Patl1_35771 [Pistacia atlantica]|nr:hypothetical protein Patl1_35771 [Pistacia atlantica]